MKKTNIYTELQVLEKANYKSLDEKRITIDAWLVNKIAELQEQYHNFEILANTIIDTKNEEIKKLQEKLDNLYGKMDYLYESNKKLQEQIDEMKPKKINLLQCKDEDCLTAPTPHFHPEQDQEKDMRIDKTKSRFHSINIAHLRAKAGLPVVKLNTDQEKLEDREECGHGFGSRCSICWQGQHNNFCKHIETEE